MTAHAKAKYPILAPSADARRLFGEFSHPPSTCRPGAEEVAKKPFLLACLNHLPTTEFLRTAYLKREKKEAEGVHDIITVLHTPDCGSRFLFFFSLSFLLIAV